MTKEEIIEMARKTGFVDYELDDGTTNAFDKRYEAFAKLVAEKAIKEALAKEKALQALHDENERLGLYKDAYAEQEPMAWISTGPARMFHWTSDKPAYGDDWVPLYTTPPPCPTCEALAQPEQEPVAWEQFHEHMAGPNYVAPQRTWVGLTDEERDEICLSDESIARSIEAKLREKNGGNHGS